MKNIKPNYFTGFGALMVAFTLLIDLPEFLNGLCLGAGIGLELIGLYAVRHDMSRFRNAKMNMVNRIIKGSRNPPGRINHE